jgi:hypothetical protein
VEEFCLARPSVVEIYECRDAFVADLNEAVSHVIDLEDEPFARHEAADFVRAADERLGALCRLLARAVMIPPEDAPSLDGLEAELRRAADAVSERDNSAVSERADRIRKLRLEAAE